MVANIDAQIKTMANTFAFGRITLFFSQSIIAEPIWGKEVSQECILLELLLKRYADKIKKGVPGITGRARPKSPRAKLTHAKT